MSESEQGFIDLAPSVPPRSRARGAEGRAWLVPPFAMALVCGEHELLEDLGLMNPLLLRMIRVVSMMWLALGGRIPPREGEGARRLV